MKHGIRIAAVFAVTAGLWSFAAAEPNINFDQGSIDVKAVVKQARKTAAAAPAGFQTAGMISRWTRDCEDITFKEGDGPLSEMKFLKATIYEQRCQNIPPAGQICHEIPYRSETRQVRIRIEGRGPLAAGEKEVFQVCLDGWFLSARTRQSQLKYDFKLPDKPEGLDDIITARVKKAKKK
ncbi:MAG: hypothetical protein ABIJ96_10205 [Elusimicrobiota bacterium]